MSAHPEPFDSPLVLSLSKDERLAQDVPAEGCGLAVSAVNVVLLHMFCSRTFAIALTLVLAAASLAAQTAPPEGNAQNGKRAFSAYYCYACHGTMGQGGSAGARIAPRPIAFAAFQKYLRQPTGQMPPYRPSVVNDQELADIYAFLRSVPASQPAKAIPLLSQ
jgi:mono/diheme cytochrome c family protein